MVRKSSNFFSSCGNLVFRIKMKDGNEITLHREICGESNIEGIRDAAEHLEELALSQLESDEDVEVSFFVCRGGSNG